MVAKTELKPGAIGSLGNLVQAVTHIAPGLNILLGLTFIVSFAGVTAPIAYLLGGVICLGVAIVLTQVAKEFTGAGGYFLYVSRTIGPRFGWLTSWLYFLYDQVAVGSVCAFTGSLVHDTLKTQYGWNIPWWLVFAVLVTAVTVFSLFGLGIFGQGSVGRHGDRGWRVPCVDDLRARLARSGRFQLLLLQPR